VKYRVYWTCTKSGYIDFEVDSKADLDYIIKHEVHDPSGDYDFYEESSENVVEFIDRIVPHLVVEVELTGLITFANLSPGNFPWRWQPEYDKRYMESVSIQQCFCLLPRGDL
jgi:hypothetical protein